MSENGVVQEVQPDKASDDWLRQVGTTLRRHYPYAFLIAGVLLYVLVLIAQARRSDAAPSQNWTDPIQAGKVELRIAYPEKLFQDGPNKTQALSAWLTYTDTTSAPAPYIVTFEPITGSVAFVNQAGVPIAPQLTLTPTVKIATPAILYVQKAALAKGGQSPVTITVRLLDTDGKELNKDNVEIHLETRWGGFWRHLGERILSPTTPVLTLAVGLVGLAIQELRRAEEQRARAKKKAQEIAAAKRKRLEQEKQNRRQARVAEIEQIHRHLPYRLDEALALYVRYTRLAETSPEWKCPEISTSLAAVWAAIKQHEWQSAALSEAATQLQAGDITAASEKVELVLQLDRKNQEAQDLKLTIELARIYRRKP